MNNFFKPIVTLFLGILIGGGVFAVAQQANPPQRIGVSSGPITEEFYSGNKEGLRVNNSPVALLDVETKLVDLPPFVPSEKLADQDGRYQALNLGNEKDFIVLDTRTGLINAYYESGTVRIYNSHVPNHALEAPLKVHVLGEELR